MLRYRASEITIFFEIVNTVVPFLILASMAFGTRDQLVAYCLLACGVQLCGVVAYVVGWLRGDLSRRTILLEVVNTIAVMATAMTVTDGAVEWIACGVAVVFALQVASLISAAND